MPHHPYGRRRVDTDPGLTGLAATSEQWMVDGLCRNHPHPDAWYPDGRHPGYPVDPIAVCQRCPVRVECLRYALDNAEVFGVWGGTSSNQRRTKFRRNQGAA